MPVRVLARFATTGIYLLHGIPRDLQRAARLRAVSEGTTLRSTLLQALREYAAGTWTPRPDGESPNRPLKPTPVTGAVADSTTVRGRALSGAIAKDRFRN